MDGWMETEGEKNQWLLPETEKARLSKQIVKKMETEMRTQEKV
jgi:hypothetical protein